MKKIVLVLCVLIITFNVDSQVIKTVNVSSAGTLSSLLSTSEKSNVTNLIVTGTIDARDVKCIRDEVSHLSVLDLGSTTIVAYNGTSGTVDAGSYSSNYPANDLPSSSFYNSSKSIAKTSLGSIILPNNLVSIGDHAFQSCSGLASITFPSSLTTISAFAFIGCSGLSKIVLPSGLKRISMGVFVDCTNLTNVDFPEGLEYIDMNAFNNCTGIQKVMLPSTLKSLGSNAFQNCTSISGNLVIPNNIARIEDNSFDNCRQIDSLTLSSSLTYVGYQAFRNCVNLKTIFSKNSAPPTLNDVCFSGATSIINVFVPVSTIYKSTISWSTLFPGDIIKNDGSVRLENVIDRQNVYATPQGIKIDGITKGVHVKLLDVNGTILYDRIVDEEQLLLNVNKYSLYIVVVGDQIFKVLI